MSRLWNSLQARLPEAPKQGIGLAVGRGDVTVAHCARTADGWEVRAGETVTLAGRLFEGTPDPDVGKEVAAVLERLCEPVRGTTIPVQIALPDPVVSLQTLEFDQLPKTESERMKLVSWRFAKHLAVDADLIRCTFQELGTCDGKRLLLASAISRPWLELVLQACREANVTPAVVDAGISYHFNSTQDCIAAGADGALLVVQPDQWTLLLCDAERRPRFVRSRWWDRAQVSAPEAVAVEAERLIRAYVHGFPGRHIGTVVVAGTAPEVSELAARLDHRMQTPCVRIPVRSLFQGAEGMIPAIFERCSAAYVAGLPR